MVSISNGNIKLGGVPSISFPPVITCQNCDSCAKKCYALKMIKFRKSIGDAWERNLKEWKENPDAVKYAILSKCITSPYFRYFVGGDIPDAEFFQMMREIAQLAPRCNFLAFTKKFDIVNNSIDHRGPLPQNLKIIFSGWGEELRPNNPHLLPESDVIFKGEEVPDGAKVCGGSCFDCLCRGVGCWELKKGEKILFFEH